MEKSERINELEKLLENFKEIRFERKKEIDGSFGEDYYMIFGDKRGDIRAMLVFGGREKRILISQSNSWFKERYGLDKFRLYQKIIERMQSAGYKIIKLKEVATRCIYFLD